MAHTRKLHYRDINASADQHTGRKGDIWFDPENPVLRTYNGDPGGEPLGSGGLSESNFKDYGVFQGTGDNAAIDLTKKYHWIVDLDSGNYYTLADGVQGQEIVFFPCVGLRPQDDSSDIVVDNMKYWNDSGPSSQWAAGARVLRLFTNTNANNVTGAITAVYVNGCWNFSAGAEDKGAP
jgi:hypothetical protein